MKKFVLDTSAILRLFIPDGPLPVGLEKAVSEATSFVSQLITPELALNSAVIAKHFKLSGYDAFFLALAEERDAVLISADEELNQAFRKLVYE